MLQMSGFEHEHFSYIQIDRPITAGVDELQRRIHALGKRYLSTVPTTALPESILKMHHDQETNEVGPSKFVASSRPLRSPLLEVFHARNISTVLFRRVAPSHDRMRYRFGRIAEEAENDFGLLDDLRQLGYSRNVDPESGNVICEKAVFLDDAAWGKTLALMPEASTNYGALLHDQSIVAEYKLENEVPDLAKVHRFETPSLPVASYHIRTESPEELQRLDEFAEIVTETVLPVKIFMDGVRAYKAYIQSTFYSG